MASSSLGAFAFPVVGDSPWSYYKFNYGTALDPAIGWVKYHTNGMTCPRPDPSACAAWDAPITFVWQGTRPVMANLQGNVVEAYPPGGAAEVGVWADVVYEEARVTRTVDGQGREHFRALGTNAWRRERLTDSEIRLRPLSPGTAVAATAAHVGEGRYTALHDPGRRPPAERRRGRRQALRAAREVPRRRPAATWTRRRSIRRRSRSPASRTRRARCRSSTASRSGASFRRSRSSSRRPSS